MRDEGSSCSIRRRSWRRCWRRPGVLTRRAPTDGGASTDFDFGYRMADAIAGARHRPDHRGEGQGGRRGRGDGRHRRGDRAAPASSPGRACGSSRWPSRTRTCASTCRSSASPPSRRCGPPARRRCRSTPGRRWSSTASACSRRPTRPASPSSGAAGAAQHELTSALRVARDRRRPSRPASCAHPRDAWTACTLRRWSTPTRSGPRKSPRRTEHPRADRLSRAVRRRSMRSSSPCRPSCTPTSRCRFSSAASRCWSRSRWRARSPRPTR